MRQLQGARRLMCLVASGCLLVAGCGGSYLDDVAGALRISRSRAQVIIRRSATASEVPEETAARTIVEQADTLRDVRPTIRETVDDILARMAARAPTAEEVIEGTYCSLLVEARFETLPADPQALYERTYAIAIEEYQEAWADALWRVGWIRYIADVVAALQAEDPQGVALVVADILYCST